MGTTTQPDTGERMSDAPAPTEPTNDDADTAVDAEAALKAEIEKWKGLARKHEDRAKQNSGAAKELEEAKKAAMSDTERAVAEATAAARAAVLAEVGGTLVDAEFKAAAAALTAAGRAVDADALLEGDTLNRSAFLGEDGKPDSDAIAKWLDRVAPKAPDPGEQQQQPAQAWPDFGQGQRGTSTTDMPLNGDPLLRDLKSKLGIE